ncbi:protease complex subunit PrcB family protein [Clostridium swellfunianum]|uniref:protease complex subunit PrcB family protein n=1 Tax=Clostridium swellfunianum TaxID=1367462 RepID=UPI00202E759A|nr:protease complex subunit PrcB family protein [Clostridium swellfunianum]MCM0646968.1 protease complex subunit PrcB family protein [Clostridium swellfunianum]
MIRWKRTAVLFLLTIFLFGCTETKGIKNKNTNEAIKGNTASFEEKNREPQGINANKITFEEVRKEALPQNMSNSINNLKANKGYLVYEKDGYYYVAVLLGKKNTGGYSIRVLSIEDNEGKTLITIEDKGPSPDINVIQAITYPYTVVKVTGVTPNITIQTTKGERFEKIMNEEDIY